MSVPSPRPVLILGAGINGCAVARELVLNRVPVCLVDARDIATGATSRSSRLIHGGLRYLEYGDVGLVRESLVERSRLLRLAPQFVRPLRLFIPLSHRAQGLLRAGLTFFGLSRTRLARWINRRAIGRNERGLWPVRVGLTLYDLLAGRDELPGHEVASISHGTELPKVDRSQYRWLAAYSDAQMLYPERFVLALLEDAHQVAEQEQIEFRIFTYAQMRLEGAKAQIRPARMAGAGLDGRPGERRGVSPPCPDQEPGLREDAPAPATQLGSHKPAADNQEVLFVCEPSVIINATGAWGDLTLGDLKIKSPRLFGGTKGSHFMTFHPQLRRAIGNDAVYAEAPDGRLVFVLPFRDGVLVGTTDEHFEQRPELAVATEAELDYLLEMVNRVFGLHLTREEVALHYSGVRPLPHASTATTAAISRSHSIAVQEHEGIPVLTLIGGKLTTCREFGEQVADRVLETLGKQRIADTRERVIPGGEDYPPTPAALEQEWTRLAERFGLSVAQVEAVWSLCGRRAETIFAALAPVSPENLSGTSFPWAYVRWVIAHEWVTTLDDLVERRLMLLYQPELTEDCLRQLAGCLVEAHLLAADQVDSAVRQTIDRLQRVYGKAVSMRNRTTSAGVIS